MPELITIFWRDIPSQVIAKGGRRSAKVKLSNRFQTAIDRAAMRAGKGGSDLYLDEWRREPRACGVDLEAEASTAAAALEERYSDELLQSLIKSKGLDSRLTDDMAPSHITE